MGWRLMVSGGVGFLGCCLVLGFGVGFMWCEFGFVVGGCGFGVCWVF